MITKINLTVEVEGEGKISRVFNVDAPEIIPVDLSDMMMNTLKAAFNYQPQHVYEDRFMAVLVRGISKW